MTSTFFEQFRSFRAGVHFLRALCGVLLLWVCMPFEAQGLGTRIKDIAVFSGARENQLSGVGLVVGLAGDGDKNPTYTLQAFSNMLLKYGISIPASTISAKNVALVAVTAELKPFTKPGTRINVTVAALGDALSLNGGVLLQTPLFGAGDRTKPYAVAQGSLLVSGVLAGSGGNTVQKNHPAVGVMSGGALVEREVPAHMVQDQHVDLLLREPDFTTAARMAEAINQVFTNSAQALDSITIRVRVPDGLEQNPVDFLTRLEPIEVFPDGQAKVIINERSGTIVATSQIKISACAISHGDLTITIASTKDVSQPNALAGGTTAVTDRVNLQARETKSRLIALEEMPTIEKVASGLNAIGVTPRDMMAIFQAMQDAGALQAELVLR